MSIPTKAPSREELQAQAESAIKGRSGFASGGRLAQEDEADTDKRITRSGVSQHESHLHKGEPKTDLKLKSGGKVKGEKPRARMDKRARGGALGGEPKSGGKKHGGGKPAVNVNIISPGAGEAEKKQAAAAGLQAGAKIGAAQAMRGGAGGPPPGGPPGAPPPPGAMPPPGAGPGGPGGQPPMKRGGRAEGRKRGGEC